MECYGKSSTSGSAASRSAACEWQCPSIPAAGTNSLVFAVGLLSRAEALQAASSTQGQHSAQNKSQALSQSEIDNVQQLLIQNTKVLTKLQEVLRRDNRDIAIMSDIQHSNGLALMIA